MILLKAAGKLIPFVVVAGLMVTHGGSVLAAADEILAGFENMVACAEERSRLAEAIADGHDNPDSREVSVSMQSGVALASVANESGERCGEEGPLTRVTFTDGSSTTVPGHSYSSRVVDGRVYLQTR